MARFHLDKNPERKKKMSKRDEMRNYRLYGGASSSDMVGYKSPVLVGRRERKTWKNQEISEKSKIISYTDIQFQTSYFTY